MRCGDPPGNGIIHNSAFWPDRLVKATASLEPSGENLISLKLACKGNGRCRYSRWFPSSGGPRRNFPDRANANVLPSGCIAASPLFFITSCGVPPEAPTVHKPPPEP